MSGKVRIDSSRVPYTTPRTCTDRSCDGSCGRNHPYAPVAAWDDEEGDRG